MFPIHPPLYQQRLSRSSATPALRERDTSAQTSLPRASIPAEGHLPKRRASAADTSGQTQQASKRPRTVAPFDRLPTEIVERILEHFPDKAGNRLTSLARTSRSNYEKALEKTRAKIKATQLIDRANKIIDIETPTGGLEALFSKRLKYFCYIIQDALNKEVPLRGKDLADVFVALAENVFFLGMRGHQGQKIMMGILEDFGGEYFPVRSIDPECRKEEQIFLDTAKYELSKRLSGNCLFISEIVDVGETFDRLLGVMSGIHSLDIKKSWISGMYLEKIYSQRPQEIGVNRFCKIFDLIDDNANYLSDRSILTAIVHLGKHLPGQFGIEGSCFSKNFNKLIGYIAKIGNPDISYQAFNYLTGLQDNLSLEASNSVNAFAFKDILSSLEKQGKDHSENFRVRDLNSLIGTLRTFINAAGQNISGELARICVIISSFESDQAKSSASEGLIMQLHAVPVEARESVVQMLRRIIATIADNAMRDELTTILDINSQAGLQ